jgi:ABC-type uncharacterized transport system substrate-binding protein
MRLLKLAINGSALVVLLQIIAASQAAAHPHVWITTEVEVLYNQDKAITGFREKWTFDEMYTAFAIQGLDKNKDGKYDRNELQELAKVNINALKEFQYFTFPKIDGIVSKELQPEKYWMEHKDGNLSLKFTLTLDEPVPYDKIASFSFAVYDPTFYIELSFARDNPIRLVAAPKGCAPKVKAPPPQKVSVQSLSESFFQNLNPKSGMAAGYANTVRITCSAS